jgi:hypothetical protein
MGAAYLEQRYLSSGGSRREAPQQIVVRVAERCSYVLSSAKCAECRRTGMGHEVPGKLLLTSNIHPAQG